MRMSDWGWTSWCPSGKPPSAASPSSLAPRRTGVRLRRSVIGSLHLGHSRTGTHKMSFAARPPTRKRRDAASTAWGHSHCRSGVSPLRCSTPNEEAAGHRLVGRSPFNADFFLLPVSLEKKSSTHWSGVRLESQSNAAIWPALGTESSNEPLRTSRATQARARA